MRQVDAYTKLANEELLPLGIQALHDIGDNIAVLAEVRARFRKGTILGYTSFSEFVEKNSTYSIRTIQRRLSDVFGIDESKINDRYKEPAPVTPVAGVEVEPVTEPAAAMASGNFWEELHGRLNVLVPSYSDGTEHKTVAMLQQALAEPANTKAEKNFRKYVIELLATISKDFSEYAQKLAAEYAEIVQAEHPTTSGETAYQVDHSAPVYEAVQ